MELKVSVSRRRLLKTDTLGEYASESWINYSGEKIPTFLFVFYIDEEDGKFTAELRDARDDHMLDVAKDERALDYLYDLLKTLKAKITPGIYVR